MTKRHINEITGIMRQSMVGTIRKMQPTFNKEEMMPVIEKSADELTEVLISLRNHIIENDGDTLLKAYKKENEKQKQYGIIQKFLLNKDKKYSKILQDKIVLDLDFKILKKMLGLEYDNDFLENFITQEQSKKVRAMFIKKQGDIVVKNHQAIKKKFKIK